MFLGAVAILLAAAFLLPCKAQALSAGKAILLDGETGRVLYARNENARSLIASTTKIMTALVICEQCNVLDRMRIPKEAVGIEGSSMYLREGEILTLQELLYGLMLQSGNDAAVALAIYCGGTVEGFSQMMNDKARLLGLKDTHFVNPHGLDHPDHYSTARDLAVLAAYAMKDPIFSKTVSTKSVTVADRYLTNHNKLLWRIEGANGVKTGYTMAAGRILVSGAKRAGRQLVAVTIQAPDDWNDHKKLFDYGFSRFSMETIIRKGEPLCALSVFGGTQADVIAVADNDFVYPIAEGEKISFALSGPGFFYAPISKNQFLGYAYILVDGSVVGKISLTSSETIEQREVSQNGLLNRLFGG